jgi:hypothetical protein
MKDGSNKPKRLIDRLAESAQPRNVSEPVSGRPHWWWFLVMPGKVILWLEFMFPERIASVFGTARRRNVPLMQVLYSLYFYLTVIAIGLALFN